MMATVFNEAFMFMHRNGLNIFLYFHLLYLHFRHKEELFSYFIAKILHIFHSSSKVIWKVVFQNCFIILSVNFGSSLSRLILSSNILSIKYSNCILVSFGGRWFSIIVLKIFFLFITFELSTNNKFNLTLNGLVFLHKMLWS